MKRILSVSFALSLLVLLAGCKKDSITEVAPSSETKTEEGGSDDYSSETFSKSVSVVFSTTGSAVVSDTTSDFLVTVEGNGRGRTNAYISGSGIDVGADIFRRGLCLPSDNKMKPEEQDRIIEIIHGSSLEPVGIE